ncbi:polysaccharide pyruvyl transferase family protein [Phocaeicola coprophilus]|uniref:polysaccharide pyruvyl transferase family protein n=1 Tax=Phocaeicola coprophilus TaxID=387090 RepID=UPI0022DEDB0D|nr:polysaccharide pyruvyl transferase family protein [Phocaeicola coprophilus]
MKIGIITFWQTQDNYGQVLQCYALQQVLLSLGYSPFLIRYTHSEVILLNKKERILSFIKNIFKKKQKKQTLQYISNTKNRNFEEFKQQYIIQSPKTYKSLKELQKYPPQADAYITGSDQVWAKSLYYNENKTFFLEFGGKNIKRISYAASFAMQEYPIEYRKKLKKLLCKFDYISVREKSGVNICASIGCKAQHVLDPTLLLPFSFYIQALKIKTKEMKQLFIYSINISSPNDIRWEEIYKYSIKNNLNTIITTSSGYVPSNELFGNVTYDYCSIPKWIENIANSKLVITTSFHGVVFCLLCHTNFVYFPLNGKFSGGNNRVIDLLTDLSLKNKIYHPDISLESIINQFVDWNKVEKKIEELRINSLAFLNKAL